MNTQFINATDINPVWFHFFNTYTGERKSSHLDDFAHLRYKNVKLLHIIDALRAENAALRHELSLTKATTTNH